jgi:hypothetical protein
MNKTDKDRYDKLVQIGCIVCRNKMGVYSIPEIHHINGRTGNGNQETIGLCTKHHREGSDNEHWTSRHPWRKRFEARYGTEAELLAKTNELLEEL